MAQLTPPTSEQPTGWSPHVGSAAAAALPTIPPEAPWLYAHYPMRWFVDAETGEVLPDLVQISGEPGVGGTGKEVPGGGGDMSGAILDAQRRGATVFHDTVLSGLGHYIRPVATRGGRVFLDLATAAIPGTAIRKIDAEKRRAMLRAFAELVPPPGEHVLDALLERAERDHAAASRDADRDPLQRRAADRHARAIEALRAALSPEPAPPPPKTRARRKTPTPAE